MDRLNILITGGNGYIAKILYKELNTKHNVKAITRNDFDLTNQLEVNNFFKKNYFDIVFHCAVNGGNRLFVDDYKVMDNNLIMYYNLCLNKNYKKLIHFGSGAEVYKSNEPYGLSKKIIRNSILEKENFYNIRLFGVFDENENDRRFIKSNILRYIKKENMIIHKNKYMDFFYTKDLIKIVNYYICNENPLKEIDCVYEKKYSLTDIANIINDLNEYKVPIQIESNELDLDYIGKYENLGITYDGLEKGIKTVYDIFIENTIND